MALREPASREINCTWLTQMSGSFPDKIVLFVHQLWHVLCIASFFTNLFSKGPMLTIVQQMCDYFNTSGNLAQAHHTCKLTCWWFGITPGRYHNMMRPFESTTVRGSKMLQTLDWEIWHVSDHAQLWCIWYNILQHPRGHKLLKDLALGKADGSFNSLGFKKAWQTNLTRCLISIPNFLPSDLLLATPACLQGSLETKLSPGATEHDVLDSFLWTCSVSESCWQMYV